MKYCRWIILKWKTDIRFYSFSMIIPPAPPPPLQIAAQPFWPGFNVCTKWPTIRAPDILKSNGWNNLKKYYDRNTLGIQEAWYESSTLSLAKTHIDQQHLKNEPCDNCNYAIDHATIALFTEFIATRLCLWNPHDRNSG